MSDHRKGPLSMAEYQALWHVHETVQRPEEPDTYDPTVMQWSESSPELIYYSLPKLIASGRLYVKDEHGEMQPLHALDFWRKGSLCTVFEGGSEHREDMPGRRFDPDASPILDRFDGSEFDNDNDPSGGK